MMTIGMVLPRTASAETREADRIISAFTIIEQDRTPSTGSQTLYAWARNRTVASATGI